MTPEQQLENEMIMIMMEQDQGGEMNGISNLGFFKKSFKRFKRSVRNTVKNPVKAYKKRVKRVVKAAKKAAPYAVAGAALYYGAPYAIMAGKYLGAKAMGVKAMIGAAGAAGAGGEQMGPPAPASSFMSPEVLSMAGGLARQAMRRQGVNVQSPQAQQAVQQYVDATAMRAQQGVVPGGMGDGLTKYLLPAAVGVGTVLMLKG